MPLGARLGALRNLEVAPSHAAAVSIEEGYGAARLQVRQAGAGDTDHRVRSPAAGRRGRRCRVYPGEQEEPWRRPPTSHGAVSASGTKSPVPRSCR